MKIFKRILLIIALVCMIAGGIFYAVMQKDTLATELGTITKEIIDFAKEPTSTQWLVLCGFAAMLLFLAVLRACRRRVGKDPSMASYLAVDVLIGVLLYILWDRIDARLEHAEMVDYVILGGIGFVAFLFLLLALLPSKKSVKQPFTYKPSGITIYLLAILFLASAAACLILAKDGFALFGRLAKDCWLYMFDFDQAWVNPHQKIVLVSVVMFTTVALVFIALLKRKRNILPLAFVGAGAISAYVYEMKKNVFNSFLSRVMDNGTIANNIAFALAVFLLVLLVVIATFCLVDVIFSLVDPNEAYSQKAPEAKKAAPAPAPVKEEEPEEEEEKTPAPAPAPVKEVEPEPEPEAEDEDDEEEEEEEAPAPAKAAKPVKEVVYADEAYDEEEDEEDEDDDDDEEEEDDDDDDDEDSGVDDAREALRRRRELIRQRILAARYDDDDEDVEDDEVVGYDDEDDDDVDDEEDEDVEEDEEDSVAPAPTPEPEPVVEEEPEEEEEDDEEEEEETLPEEEPQPVEEPEEEESADIYGGLTDDGFDDESEEDEDDDDEDEDEDGSSEPTLDADGKPSFARGKAKPMKEKMITILDDEKRERYNAVRNELQSYKKVSQRMSAKGDSYRFKRELIAKIDIGGKTLKLHLALNPEEFEGTKYSFQDLSAKNKYMYTPLTVKLTSSRSVKHSIELIGMVAQAFGLEKNPKYQEKDYASEMKAEFEAEQAANAAESNEDAE